MTQRLSFPSGFVWGSATAAHQVEGNNTNNQWWEWEQAGGNIHDGSVSGIACDYWNRFDDDHRLAAELGHQSLRISIEWSRVERDDGVFDREALDHYKRILDSMRRHGIVPTVTLHHFTNPIWAQRKGGWENPAMASWLARFTELAVREFGDRVKLWWTINEPTIAPMMCYLFGVHPPAVRDLSRALVVARNVLVAHGSMYRAAHEAATQPIEIGPVLQMPYFEPLDSESEADRAAATLNDTLANEYYLRGLTEGVVQPPVGDGEEVAGLAGSYDVIGVNYYLRMLCEGGGPPETLQGSKRRPTEPPRFVDEMGWEVYPEGLYRQLMRVAPLDRPIYVTENGMATLDDDARTEHLREHLEKVARAIEDGADVRGYFYWSTMDNFEWAEGYSRRFGLVAIDRKTLARRPRPTAFVYRDIISQNAVICSR
jgi:beta-glucosidase